VTLVPLGRCVVAAAPLTLTKSKTASMMASWSGMGTRDDRALIPSNRTIAVFFDRLTGVEADAPAQSLRIGS
jgi:hypothetical protein